MEATLAAIRAADYEVQYICGVPKVWRAASRLVVVCDETAAYRAFARVVDETDAVLEIGVDWGIATALLDERTRGNALGVDIVESCVAKARERYPHVRFERCDAIGDPATLAALRPARGEAWSKVWLDINGCAELVLVLAALSNVVQLLRPSLVIVKSKQLSQLLRLETAAAATTTAIASSTSDAPPPSDAALKAFSRRRTVLTRRQCRVVNAELRIVSQHVLRSLDRREPRGFVAVGPDAPTQTQRRLKLSADKEMHDNVVTTTALCERALNGAAPAHILASSVADDAAKSLADDASHLGDWASQWAIRAREGSALLEIALRGDIASFLDRLDKPPPEHPSHGGSSGRKAAP